MNQRIKILALILFVQTMYTFSQNLNMEDIEADFYEAVELYSDGKLSEALSIFNNISEMPGSNSKITASQIFKAKILIQENKYSESKKILTSFIERYPGSRYVDEARMMLVKISYEEANYFASLKEIGFLLDNSFSSEYIGDAKPVGDWIAFNYLSTIQLQRLVDSFSGINSKPYFLLLLGKSYIKSNNISEAQNIFEQLITNYPESDEYDEAKKLLESPQIRTETSSSTNIIGVMLPLQTDESGNYTSATAMEILDGIKYAVNEFNSGRNDKIGIVIRDTKADSEIISQIKDEFIDDPAVKVILGPLFSDEVRVTLEEFDGSGIPIISPTATDDDLTSINEDFFQANPTFSQRGKIIAQYAYHIENRIRVSILNSIDGYSPLLASNFEEEFKRLGGEILTRQSFKSKSFDLGSPVSRIAADSLIIEGLYVPLSDNLDAPGILSELVKCSLKVPIYG
ncbi:MAG TPA: ABC transporter substrate-binding protein, partial [Ignavibacteriaceae bacterium]